MKILYSIAGALVLLSTAASAQHSLVGTNEVSVQTFNLSGVPVEYIATQERISRCPTWDTVAPPPVTVSNATATARDWIRQNKPELQIQDIPIIQLIRSSPRDSEGHYQINGPWYYFVYVNLIPTEEDPRGTSVPPVLVLMDGAVVEPRYLDGKTDEPTKH